MFSKLKSNYNLSNVLARVLFVLTFVFANWKQGIMATIMLWQQPNWPVALASTAILGIGVMFVLPIFVNCILNVARLHSLPRAEYCLLAHAFCALGNFICGALNLINLFTPVLLVWGTVLFPFVSTLVASVLFYRTTSKLYFNDVTKVYYFKVCIIVFVALVLVLEVL